MQMGLQIADAHDICGFAFSFITDIRPHPQPKRYYVNECAVHFFIVLRRSRVFDVA